MIMAEVAGPKRMGRVMGVVVMPAMLAPILGPVVGGLILEHLHWSWIFFVYVPIGIGVLLVTRSIVRESRVEAKERHFDALGAALITSSLVLLVYALTQANSNGWSSAETIGVLAASAVLMVLFLVTEHRSKAPLIPLGIFRRLQTLTGANIVTFFLGALTFAMFFMLSLYMQQVLGLSALQTGVGYLAVALTAVVSAGVAQAGVTKIGVKPALLFGLAMMALGNLWFTQVSPDGSYAVDLLPGFFAIGIGLGFSFVPVSIAALAGVTQHEAGLASGLFNTSQQIGGALGVAILSTVATRRSGGSFSPDALTRGFSTAFWVAVAFAIVAIVATLTMIHPKEIEAAPVEEPSPA
jgi:EmrB/QacA subfamily drug resistance transporter